MKKGYTIFYLGLFLAFSLLLMGCTDYFDMRVTHTPSSVDSGVQMSGAVQPQYSVAENLDIKQNLPAGNYRFYQAILVPTGNISIATVPTSMGCPGGTLVSYASNTLTTQLNQHYRADYGQNPPPGYRWSMYRCGSLQPVNLGADSLNAVDGVSILNSMFFTARQPGDFYPTYAFGIEAADTSPPLTLNQTWNLYRDHIVVYRCLRDADCSSGSGCVNYDCVSCNGYNPNQRGCCYHAVFRWADGIPPMSHPCGGYSYESTAKDCIIYNHGEEGFEAEQCSFCQNATATCATGRFRCQGNIGSWSPFACTANPECNDTNPCTTELCSNPNTCSARCQYTPVADNTQCGNSGICSNGQCIGECPLGTTKVSKWCGATIRTDAGTNACTSDAQDYVCVNAPNTTTNTCAYNTTAYRIGYNLSDANLPPYPRNVTCSNGFWCPKGFFFNTTSGLCRFAQPTCEQGNPAVRFPARQITCSKGSGLPATWGLWTDQDPANGNNPFWNPNCFYNLTTAKNSNPLFVKACCESVQWAGIAYYTLVNITPNTASRDRVDICGDIYPCGASDNVCPELYGPRGGLGTCTVDDVDCCGSGRWNGTAYATKNLVWYGTTCCGDDANEVHSWEKGISLPLSKVLDAENSTACCSAATDCVDDGLCYASESSKNIDDATGDEEICVRGVWRDPDEDESICLKGGFRWFPQPLPENPFGGIDDYDNNTQNGYCEGDDGVLVYGTVSEQIRVGDETTQPSQEVFISMKSADAKHAITNTTTHGDGSYEVSLPPGIYTLLFSKRRYLTEALSGVEIQEQTRRDITLRLSDECQDDCTKNDFICHTDCAGKAGCRFHDSITRRTCNNKQKGWLIDYGAQKVECCEGKPLASSVYIAPVLDLYDIIFPNDIRNIITVRRYLYYRGEPITMYVTLYRCDENEACKQATQSSK